jgi:hypothetical protein
MPVSSLARHIYGRKILSFNPSYTDGTVPIVGTLTNLPTSTTNLLAFVCPVSGNLKKITVGTLTNSGSEALTVQVKRSSTVLGAAVTDAAATLNVGDSGNLTAPVSIGELLIVSALAPSATDDFTGVTVLVEFEHDFGDDANI